MNKSKEISNVVFLLVTVILLLPAVSLADGFFVTPIGSFMYEPTQQAYIEYDGERRVEKLTILPGFTGDATSFAWIVPVPGLPEVALADAQIFRDLDLMTRPISRSRDGDWDCLNRPGPVVYDNPDGGIEVVSSQLVGYYQTLVLSATEAPALITFLTGLGYLHEDNLEATTAALNDYVDRSWYFVAMQVDSTALAEIYPYHYGDGFAPYYSGGLDPIQLTFASERIIYPMKISALSAPRSAKVHLYVKTDHRVTFPGATTFYANRFSSEEIDGLSLHLAVRCGLQPGDFLTKLQRGYQPAEMTEDVILVPSPGNHEYQMIIYSGLPLTGLLILSVPLGIAAKRRFWIRLRLP